MRKLMLISLIIALVSCIPVTPVAYVDYVVPAGQNISMPRAQIPVPTEGVSFSFKTNDTWVWQKPEPSGFSKVAGLFFKTNHYTSARVVFDGEYLGYYFYVEGRTPMQTPGYMGRLWPVIINHEYYAKTGWENDSLFIHLSDNQHNDTTIRVFCKKPDIPALFSQPWVGGRYTINHNWIVSLKLN